MKARDNPFRSGRLSSVRYRLDGISWGELFSRLEQMRFRGALVGPHGSGKTTLLEELAMRLRERGFGTRFLRLDAEHRAFAPGLLDGVTARTTPDEIILFDGAEQMNPLAWRRFRFRSRKAGGLIITTHRPGRLPTLHECRTSPQLLARIASFLLGRQETELRNLSRRMFEKHQGNLRDALMEFYDLVGADSEAFGIRAG